MRHLAVGISLLVLSACGGGGSPTSPTPTTPSVAGSYSGTATFTFPALQTTVSCPASTTVTQSGKSVSIAPIVLRGDCDTLSIPFGQVTIDSTGAFEGGNTTGTFNEPTCGTYSVVGSGGFFGRELRISVTATSATCVNFNFTAVLNR